MAINTAFPEVDDPIVTEFVAPEEDSEVQTQLGEGHLAVLFNMIRDRYDSSSKSPEEDEL